MDRWLLVFVVRVDRRVTGASIGRQRWNEAVDELRTLPDVNDAAGRAEHKAAALGERGDFVLVLPRDKQQVQL